jgi:hypothetical protein
MPKIGANFTYTAYEPNFTRDQYATLEDMSGVTIMDEGHLAYCKETKKTYRFQPYSEFVAPVGYWREWEAENIIDDNSRSTNKTWSAHKLSAMELMIYAAM